MQQNTNLKRKTKRKKKSSQEILNGVRQREEEKPGVYFWGLASLIVMALVGLWLSLEIMDVSEAAWGFSGLFSFGATIFVGPFWLAVGIMCLMSVRKASLRYRTDLKMMGILNITGIFVTAFCPILYKMMLFWWVVYYGAIFGTLIILAVRRGKVAELGNVEKGEDEFFGGKLGVSEEVEKRVSKKACWWGIGVIVGGILFVILAYMAYEYSSGTSMVRRKWRETALANTTIYAVKEDKELAEADRIYLSVEGVDARVSYYCDNERGGICYYEYRLGLPSGQDSLGAYFWKENQKEIDQILAKYGGKLDQWATVQIRVYDRSVIEDFVKDVLEIPDIQKLYRAYIEASKQMGTTAARTEFGDFFLDVRDGEGEERLVLFEEAEKLGL